MLVEAKASHDDLPLDEVILAAVSHFHQHGVLDPNHESIFSLEAKDPGEHPSLVYKVPERDVLFDKTLGTPSLALKSSSFALKKLLRTHALRPKLVYDVKEFSCCDPSYFLRGWWIFGVPSIALYGNVRVLVRETKAFPSSLSSSSNVNVETVSSPHPTDSSAVSTSSV